MLISCVCVCVCVCPNLNISDYAPMMVLYQISTIFTEKKNVLL